MDVRLPQDERPIYVDLDGTVIKSDLLWESLFMLARQRPVDLWRVPFWAWRGKACLKAELADRLEFDPALLPYRDEVVQEIAALRASGRRTVLATGANEKLARAVAAHLGVFDDVMASSATVNLTAEAKLDRIVAANDVHGFDYIGNSQEDICLLEAASEATVVAPDRAALRWQREAGAHLIAHRSRTDRIRAAIKAMRPHQWTKNVLVFVPLALEHDYLDVATILSAIGAFFAFAFAASAVYILNDLLDLSSDRRHRSKRHRPFASGTLSIPDGLAIACLLLALSGTITATLNSGFQIMLGCYLVLTTMYSLMLKRMLLIDVLALASLYTIRAIAGGLATNIEISFWLLAFSTFFFLSLALVKRFTELQDFGPGAMRATTGRGYQDCDIETIGQAGIASGFSSVLVLALYVDSPKVQHLNSIPWMLWLLCPLVLYIIVRIWVLARRNEMHEDPVVFILRDWRSQLMIAFGAIIFFAAAYV